VTAPSAAPGAAIQEESPVREPLRTPGASRRCNGISTCRAWPPPARRNQQGSRMKADRDQDASCRRPLRAGGGRGRVHRKLDLLGRRGGERAVRARTTPPHGRQQARRPRRPRRTRGYGCRWRRPPQAELLERPPRISRRGWAGGGFALEMAGDHRAGCARGCRAGQQGQPPRSRPRPTRGPGGPRGARENRKPRKGGPPTGRNVRGEGRRHTQQADSGPHPFSCACPKAGRQGADRHRGDQHRAAVGRPTAGTTARFGQVELVGQGCGSSGTIRRETATERGGPTRAEGSKAVAVTAANVVDPVDRGSVRAAVRRGIGRRSGQRG